MSKARFLVSITLCSTFGFLALLPELGCTTSSGSSPPAGTSAVQTTCVPQCNANEFCLHEELGHPDQFFCVQLPANCPTTATANCTCIMKETPRECGAPPTDCTVVNGSFNASCVNPDV